MRSQTMAISVPTDMATQVGSLPVCLSYSAKVSRLALRGGEIKGMQSESTQFGRYRGQNP